VFDAGGVGGPLSGLRVLDLSPDSVGAQVSQMLADFGADVIWLEPPGGSRLRSRPSFPFLARAKSSVVADLGTGDGISRVRELAEAADVLIESFRPGVADRLDIGYAALGERNPALVYLSITGFGRKGPWSRLQGYEGVVAALLGIFSSFDGMYLGEHPPFVSIPWCSFAASHCGLHGVLAALLEREESGRGQWVETNLAQAVTVHEGASSAWYSYLVARRWPDAFHLTPAVDDRGVPMSHFVFRLLVGQTKDGRWLQFAQNRPRLFEAFMRVLGLEWMMTDPKWKGIPVLDDEQLRVELWARLLGAVRERTLEEWQEVFASDHDVFAELYRHGPEVLDHPQLLHDGSTIEMDDPERGPVRQPGPMFRMSSTPAMLRGPAPTLGDGPSRTWRGAGKPPDLPASTAVGRLPLEAITVLELALQYAAPYGVTLLSDLGARIIKVEPLDGEAIRRQVPQFPEAGGGKVMQGKESVALDLKTPEAIEIVHRLAGRVDVVVEGFRDGAAERIHVDQATLRGINPDLVYLSAHGYGLGGPFGDRPSFAPTFGAAGGIAAAHLGGTGPDDPMTSLEATTARSAQLRAASASRYASADGVAALGVASAVLMGLLARARGRGGQHIVSSMLQSTAHAMADHIVDFSTNPGGVAPGSHMRGPGALYRVYDTSDGWVFLAAPQPREWERLAGALAPYVDLGHDPRFATESERRAHDADLSEVLAGVLAQRTKGDWQEELAAADVACVAVTTGPPEALLMSDEIGRAAGYITDITHPVFDAHPRLAPVVRFSRSATQARPGGLCGDSTDAVLGELGYTSDQVNDLRARKIVL
jgi:crotonobetainyl-CoA:carnitine CoA-transferase CaiB-like acyl-CoA transferase